MITAKVLDIDDLEEFLEDCLGIQFLPYQKEMLRMMWVADKMYIHIGQHLGKVDICWMYEMMKYLLINNKGK